MVIPDVVKFTNFDIEPRKVINSRIHKGAIPSSWMRVRFQVEQDGNIHKINRWLEMNIEGRWSSYIVSMRFNHRIVVIAFENDNDAVMFNLKGGQTAWKNEEVVEI